MNNKPETHPFAYWQKIKPWKMQQKDDPEMKQGRDYFEHLPDRLRAMGHGAPYSQGFVAQSATDDGWYILRRDDDSDQTFIGPFPTKEEAIAIMMILFG